MYQGEARKKREEVKVKPGRLYPFGYGLAYRDKDDADEVRNDLRLLALRPQTILLDIRLSPTGHYDYMQQALKKRFGKQYKHAPGLGNVNHKQRDMPIQLADPAPAIQKILEGLATGYSFILLCGCVHYEKCHRRFVEELVRSEAVKSGLQLEDPRTIGYGDLARWTHDGKTQDVIVVSPRYNNPYAFIIQSPTRDSYIFQDADLVELEVLEQATYRCEVGRICDGKGGSDVKYREEFRRKVCFPCSISVDPNELVRHM